MNVHRKGLLCIGLTAYDSRLKWHGKVDPRCGSDRGSSEFHRRFHLQTSSHCRQRGAFLRGCSSKESLGLTNPLQTKLFPVEHHLSILSDILRWKKSALILQRHTCSLFLVPFLGLRGTFRSSSMVFCAVSDWKLLADGQDNWEDELEDDDLTKARTCDIFYHFPCFTDKWVIPWHTSPCWSNCLQPYVNTTSQMHRSLPQDDRGGFSPELPWSELQSHHAQRFENSVGERWRGDLYGLMVLFHHVS